jgi:predicted PurR-regulated permease PerM
MTTRPAGSLLERVVSKREARLVFWLVVIALIAIIATLSAGFLSMLASPAIILFVAWLMAYVLEPPVSWLQRHLPGRGRGIPVAITYLVTAVVVFVVLGAAGIALLRAAVDFVDQLPVIVDKISDFIRPIIEWLGISLPTQEEVQAAIREFLATYAGQFADAVALAVRNIVALAAGLVTAVIISVGLAVGQVSLLGWARRFLPSSSYADLTELERAIAVSFGGFVRGRLLIGFIYGTIIAVAAFLLGVPFGPLIGIIAGVIVFIPWIGPLIGWIVLPAFALLLAPEAVALSLLISIIVAVAIQVIVTQLVMGAAVNMSPVAVFVVVFLGTSLAGVLGAVFAIPVAAAILSVTDYLRQRDVLIRAEADADGDRLVVAESETPADAAATRAPGDPGPADRGSVEHPPAG